MTRSCKFTHQSHSAIHGHCRGASNTSPWHGLSATPPHQHHRLTEVLVGIHQPFRQPSRSKIDEMPDRSYTALA